MAEPNSPQIQWYVEKGHKFIIKAEFDAAWENEIKLFRDGGQITSFSNLRGGRMEWEERPDLGRYYGVAAMHKNEPNSPTLEWYESEMRVERDSDNDNDHLVILGWDDWGDLPNKDFNDAKATVRIEKF